jgi:maleylpyruvate isomerase
MSGVEEDRSERGAGVRAGWLGNVAGMRSVEDVLRNLADATAGLLADIGGLTDADVRGPSLLPDWSRGHVLTHLARNAEGGTRLLGWARTGVPSYEYPSVAARAADIEAGAGRPAEVLVADVHATAGALADAIAAMPPNAWWHLVTWTTGQQTPADMVARSRHAEVLLHHVDLDIGYGPDSWPAEFTSEMLDIVVRNLAERELLPLAALLTATDTGRSTQFGPATDNSATGDSATGDIAAISGTEQALLAWLIGRSDGADLDKDTPGPLPRVPSIYLT